MTADRVLLITVHTTNPLLASSTLTCNTKAEILDAGYKSSQAHKWRNNMAEYSEEQSLTF
jgi:hypothetical protein